MDIKKIKLSVVSIFMLAIIYLFATFMFTISGIYGVFFTYSFPDLGSFDVIGWITIIISWIVKLIIKLFMLGMFLSLLAWGSVEIAKKVTK